MFSGHYHHECALADRDSAIAVNCDCAHKIMLGSDPRGNLFNNGLCRWVDLIGESLDCAAMIVIADITLEDHNGTRLIILNLSS